MRRRAAFREITRVLPGPFSDQSPVFRLRVGQPSSAGWPKPSLPAAHSPPPAVRVSSIFGRQLLRFATGTSPNGSHTAVWAEKTLIYKAKANSVVFSKNSLRCANGRFINSPVAVQAALIGASDTGLRRNQL